MKNKDLKEIIITQEQIEKRVKKIANMIDEKYKNEEIVLVGILKGAFVFISDIAREIQNPNIGVEFMIVNSYHNGESIGDIKVVLDLKKDIVNKNVIIVEDIIDTGKTLSKIKELLLFKGAKVVEIVAMCSKPSRRKVEVAHDYPTFIIPNEIVVGYGLDYNETYRHLPYIASLSKEGLKKYKIN